MLNKSIFFSILILIATIFMSIGYAAMNMELGIEGDVTATYQRDMFIVEPVVTSTTNVSSTIAINQIYKTILDSTITLDNVSNGYSITYQVTVYNRTNDNYAFKGIVADSGTYDNSAINYSYNGISLNEVITSGGYKTFAVTLSNSASSDNELRSYMNIAFGKNYTISYNDITTDSGIQTNIAEGLTYTNTFTDPPDDVEVTMGGTALTNGTHFTYSNGTLTIPNVTGNIVITGTSNADPYSVVIAENDTEINMSLNSMSFDDFLAQQFSFSNNSGKKIKKVTIQVSALVKKTGSGTGSQYITTTLLIDGKSAGNFSSVVLSTYSTTGEVVESQARTKTASIANGSTFSIDFSATKSNIITIEELTNLKVTVGY